MLNCFYQAYDFAKIFKRTETRTIVRQLVRFLTSRNVRFIFREQVRDSSPRILYTNLANFPRNICYSTGFFSKNPAKYASLVKTPEHNRLGIFVNCSRINSRTHGSREQECCWRRTREHLFAHCSPTVRICSRTQKGN